MPDAEANGALISNAAIIHVLLFLVGIGYAQNYYYHLRATLQPSSPSSCLC